MKKMILLAVMMMAPFGSGFAQSTGVFGYGIELFASGAGATNSGTVTLYALDPSGGDRLLPTNSTAVLSDAWTSASTGAAPTFDLGTFTTADLLTLTGGSLLTFQNGGAAVSPTGQYLNYSVVPLGNSSNYQPGINLPLDLADVPNAGSPVAGDDRWATESQSINLLAGLAPGQYELQTYGYASGNYESNQGADFGAVFTVAAVPEPTSWALGACAVGLLGVLLRLRRLRDC